MILIARAMALALVIALATTVAFEPSAIDAQASGTILAVLGRQIGILNFAEPRPTALTSVTSPSYALDLAAIPASPLVAISLVQPFGDPTGLLGADIVGFDRTTSTTRLLASRANVGETLSFPAWWPDGSALLFNRSSRTSLSGTVELLWMDGSAPMAWIADATHPAVAADGSLVAFVRYSRTAASLMALDSRTGQESTLVGGDRFLDIAYPRFSPDGAQISFSVPGEAVMHPKSFLAALFEPATALAHGFPRDIWIVGADGSNLHALAHLGADDPSLSWSPDGKQLFVYSGNGGWFIDAQSGATISRVDYLSGYGSTAWLP